MPTGVKLIVVFELGFGLEGVGCRSQNSYHSENRTGPTFSSNRNTDHICDGGNVHTSMVLIEMCRINDPVIVITGGSKCVTIKITTSLRRVSFCVNWLRKREVSE